MSISDVHYYITPTSAELTSVCFCLSSGGVLWNFKFQARDVTWHLVAVRGTSQWECDFWDWHC